mmetsp:Transcript_34434/g.55715  ORF Transcript_34434/g.55715 Transcript_34434/m.55715 type:complete len:638 (-) Transcript_34434:496-2409(-)
MDYDINPGIIGTKDDTGVESRLGWDDLSDSVLELIFLHATRDPPGQEPDQDQLRVQEDKDRERGGAPSRRAVMLVQGLAGVNRRFREIVFNGSLWSASDLSSILGFRFGFKPERLSVFSKMDLSKVHFSGSKFCFPHSSITQYTLLQICSLFDIMGPYIKELDLVGSDRLWNRSDMAAFSGSSGVEKVRAILERCPSLSSLTLGIMLLTFQSCFALMRSRSLRGLQLKLRSGSVEDMAQSMSTISTLWPNLKELLIDISHRDFKGKGDACEVPLPSQMPLSALVYQGRQYGVLRNVGSLLLQKSLVILDLSACTGFSEIVLTDDDHLEKVSLRECKGLWRAVFRNCSRLQSISSVSNSDCTDFRVEKCAVLQSLINFHGQACDAQISIIRKCPLLEDLNVRHCSLQSDDIANLPKLRNVCLSFINFVGNTLLTLDVDNLEKVHLSYLHGLVRTVFRNCSRLKSVYCWFSYDCTEWLVENCPLLRDFHINGGSSPICTMQTCPSLEDLALDRCSIEPVDIAKLPKLKKLTLAGVRDRSVVRAFRRSLKSINGLEWVPERHSDIIALRNPDIAEHSPPPVPRPRASVPKVYVLDKDDSDHRVYGKCGTRDSRPSGPVVDRYVWYDRWWNESLDETLDDE